MVAGLVGLSAPAFGDHRRLWAKRIKSIGIQLYSIPHLLNEDFPGTLEMLATIGYKELEFAGPYFFSSQSERENSILAKMFGLKDSGYYSHKPVELKKLLNDLGLKPTSAHISLLSLKESLEEILEAATSVGHRYIICPFLTAPTLDDYKAAADTFNQIGEKCQQAGIQFCYHNHSFEFGKLEGEVPLDVLLTRTDDSLMKMELDLFWTKVAGVDPLEYFSRFPGRFPLVHVKDMAAEMEPDSSFETFQNQEAIRRIFSNLTDVGQGIIDFKSILSHSRQAGIEHYFIERDFPEDQLRFVQRSYEHLSQLDI